MDSDHSWIAFIEYACYDSYETVGRVKIEGTSAALNKI